MFKPGAVGAASEPTAVMEMYFVHARTRMMAGLT
ncbi:hypothetical protein PAMH19_5139 [Pseudomonas aeruginosa]|nr:hypothetical protein PAMH19_5139 [Pseudomonas aeruginosa]